MQNKNGKQFTAQQIWVIHSLEGIAFSALAAAGITLYNAFQAGSLSKAGIGVATVVGGIIVKGVSALMANPQTIQAGEDTLNEVKSGLSQVLAGHQMLSNLLASLLSAFSQQSNQPPVHVQVNNPAPATPATPISAAAPQAVAQPVQSADSPIAPALSLPSYPGGGLPTISSVLPTVNVQH